MRMWVPGILATATEKRGRRSMSRWSHLKTGCTAKLPKAGDVVQATARPHLNPRGMNKTEAKYADDLEAMKLAGDIADWRFEPLKLRLADRTYYTPDFMVIFPDGAIRFDEVKGFWRDDARVKFKVAAEQFPWFQFMAVQALSKKQGGGWKEEVMR